MNKRKIKITAMFSVMIFVILTLTMGIIGLLTMIMFNFGLIRLQSMELFILSFAVVSIITGTVVSKIIGRSLVSRIIQINDATKKIAKGNFNVTLSENSRAEELRSMAHNFNIMTRELANTEMLRDDFISNVSHEFKTPLTAIEGYATLLQNKKLDDTKRDAYIKKIIFNTKRLSGLTGNILLLSRLENQEINIDKKQFSLDEQLRQTILLYENEWTSKNFELDVDLDIVEYTGNQELLAQVWQNLISNSVKFTDNDGELRVSLRENDSCVTVFISDSGQGMDEDEQKRIFEKFYQCDPSHSTNGNGLGLTLAKRIVFLHGGDISVKSKKGCGTCFTVVLPKEQLP
ncbi:MAG: HAMP domain-containing sensor histidine kinase [Oscillospiraceae bacterium]|nr:HAMP domain-containing sensor histidine kinase [Oscillospiraceae bacterium]